jgi:hypothetical protein
MSNLHKIKATEDLEEPKLKWPEKMPEKNNGKKNS